MGPLERPASTPLSIVLAYRQTGKVALNVLVGALETDPVTAAQVVARNLRTFQAQGLLDYEVARQRGY